jgi:hypothetical protein
MVFVLKGLEYIQRHEGIRMHKKWKGIPGLRNPIAFGVYHPMKGRGKEVVGKP